MTEHEKGEFAEWVEPDQDLASIRENLYTFSLAAQFGYDTFGRGMIMVDTIAPATDERLNIIYLGQASVVPAMDEETHRLVREYDPSGEFVAVFLKPEDRFSSYRLALHPAEGVREQLEGRIKADLANQSGHGEQESAGETIQKPPDLETLMTWSDEGYCEATDGCVVEPDGTCNHGCPSWLLELGLI